MKKYAKIQTLYNRDPKTFKVIEGDFSRPEFALINNWVVTEKIDGMNIRVDLRQYEDTLPDDGSGLIRYAVPSHKDIVSFAGRNDNTQWPPGMLEVLQKMFTVENLAALRKDDSGYSITLFGEGYGAGIQSGGYYREDKGFILFDVLVNDRFWLDRENVENVAHKLGVDIVPLLGAGLTTRYISDWVKRGFSTYLSDSDHLAEGIIAQSPVPLYNNRGERLMFKLKTKDFCPCIGS